MNKNRIRPNRNRGAALVWVVVVFTLLIGMMGLAVDAGYLMYSGHQLQNAADAAALAAAQKLSDPDAGRTLAFDVAKLEWAANDWVTLDLNEDNAIDGDIVFINYDRATGAYTTDTPWNAVMVTARRVSASPAGKIKLFFGPMWGVNSASEQRTAIAMLASATGSGVIVLDPSDEPQTLSITGNAGLDVNNGNVQVNSLNSAGAYTQDAAARIEAPRLNVSGAGADLKPGTFDGKLSTDQPQLADPLEGLTPPSVPSPAKNMPNGKNITLSPGWYPRGINVNGGNTTVTLNPGVYYLGGPGAGDTGGFSINQTSSSITGTGVTIYVAKGKIDIGGGTTVNLTPPTGEQPYAEQQLTIWQASADESTISGSGNLNIEGTIYAPHARLKIGGTGDGFGNQLIAYRLTIFGDGIKQINYTGANPGITPKYVVLVK